MGDIVLSEGLNELNVRLTPIPVITFTVTTIIGNGRGTISPWNPVVQSGASQTLIITPSAGYYTAHVWIDQRYDAGPVSRFTFDNITSDHLIMVEFYRQ